MTKDGSTISGPERRPGGPAPAAATAPVALAAFNTLPADQARGLLLRCCRAPRWAAAVAAGRPYPAQAALLAKADEALTAEDVRDALAAHPRIGESTRHEPHAPLPPEQAGLAGASPEVLAELAAGNQAYEQRFGRIYLVRAAERGPDELLRILRARLGNDPDTERAVVRAELCDINRRRLTGTITP